MRAGSMVFAVWRSASELDGVGVLVIKGQPYLRSIIRDNHPLPPNSCGSSAKVMPRPARFV